MDPFAAPPAYPARSVLVRDCTACGACCAAPDIHALGKPLGVPCVNLGPDCLCGIYSTRPAVCRSYAPDWVCGEVAPLPTLAARTRRFLEIYGLVAEAEAGKPTTSAPR
ncbi:YkgJ family cysteine cluster protein [Deinococcus aquatilis]|jgi:Fe-S-cluster containining protein|uniref:YkgJ family cysteine cluster protein n=1 Tax=Deinococcus aquatilis TaxID=519440 RepID=UPI000A01B98B|nr:YkgJ family cysteine cluster protein [Deinococcus aquatilis]